MQIKAAVITDRESSLAAIGSRARNHSKAEHWIGTTEVYFTMHG